MNETPAMSHGITNVPNGIYPSGNITFAGSSNPGIYATGSSNQAITATEIHSHYAFARGSRFDDGIIEFPRPKVIEELLVAEEIGPIYPTHLKLDLGCGRNKQAGFWGVDSIQFPGVDEVVDLRQPWPWPDNSVSEVFCSHFLEHLEQWERVHFANELWRVMKPGRWENGQPVEGKIVIVTPHWCAARAFGDPTHKWPPVSEWMYLYWDRNWRLGVIDPDPAKCTPGNAPHTDVMYVPTGYKCDFMFMTGGSWHPELQFRNDEFRQDASKWFKEAIQDTWATLTARK